LGTIPGKKFFWKNEASWHTGYSRKGNFGKGLFDLAHQEEPQWRIAAQMEERDRRRPITMIEQATFN
jgi:hypothetical protein